MPRKKNIILALEGGSGTASLAKNKLAEIGITCEICAEIEPSETETQYALEDLVGKSSQSDLILETLAEAVPELIILLLDTEGKVVYMSDYRGFKEDPIGKKQHEIFRAEIAERHMSGIRRAVETGEPVFDEEIMATPAGNIVIDVKFLPIRNSKGEVHRILGIVSDMTKHKEVEHEIRRRNLIMQALAFASEIFQADIDLAESIMKALKKLGESSDVDRAYVMKQFNEDSRIFYRICFEWCAPGIEPQINKPLLQRLDPSNTIFKRHAEILSRGDIVYGHTRDFPENEQ
ncbi:MAG: PAS domain-containing protein, partial [Victivallales bacterium]